MNIFFLFLFSFLCTLFIINLQSYLKSPHYNRWIRGTVDSIDVNDTEETWLIKWFTPENLKEKNPEGAQFYYVKFKHNKKWKTKEDQKKYLEDKVIKNISNKYYLALDVDKSGVIRGVGKYTSYKTKMIISGVCLLLVTGLWLWFH